MASGLLVEQASLTRWHTWAGERLAWVNDRLVNGDLLAAETPEAAWDPQPAAAGWEPEPITARPASTGGAGALLLAAGAFLLVMAGIAFVAFAWDALGPIGQIITLFAIGTLSMLASVPVARRLPGTATAIGTVGVLIVATAIVALRLQGPDILSARASLVWALLAALALATWGVITADDLDGVGEFAAVVGAFLSLTLLAYAPSDDAVPIAEPWSWWVAAILGVGSLALLLNARRLGVRSWPPMAVVGLATSAVTFGYYLDQAIAPTGPGMSMVLQSAVMLGSALLFLSLTVALKAHRVEWLMLVAGGLSLSALWAVIAAMTAPSARPSAALLLFVIGAVVVLVEPTLRMLGAPLTKTSTQLRRVSVIVGGGLVGAAVGFAVAPWVEWPADNLSSEAMNWVDEAWPPWRGLLAGVAFALLLAASSVIAERVAARATDDDTDWTGGLELVTLLSALSAWLVTAFNGPSAGRYVVPSTVWDSVFDQVEQRVGVGLSLTGLALLTLVLLQRLPVWHVWLGALALMVSALLIVNPDDVSTPLRPETYSLLLAIPAAVAGLIWWWQHRPDWSSSWITMAPATTLALLPPILSILDDATSRWWQSTDPGSAYQIRLAAVLGVGVLLCVAGVRQHLAGLLFPGLCAVLAVATISLIELGRFLPQWVSFAVAGLILLGAGARWESVRRLGSHGSAWARDLR